MSLEVAYDNLLAQLKVVQAERDERKDQLVAAQAREAELTAEIERKMSAAEFIIRQNNELMVDNARLRERLKDFVKEVKDADTHLSSGNADKALVGVRRLAVVASLAKSALAATPAQSLAHLHNEVLEKAAGVAYEHGANLSAKAIRAMKEPEQ